MATTSVPAKRPAETSSMSGRSPKRIWYVRRYVDDAT